MNVSLHFRHLLVVFGGLQGLEASVDADQNLDVTDPGLLFDLYLNTCPGQGSRTIRTEVRTSWEFLWDSKITFFTHNLKFVILFLTGGHLGVHVRPETKN